MKPKPTVLSKETAHLRTLKVLPEQNVPILHGEESEIEIFEPGPKRDSEPQLWSIPAAELADPVPHRSHGQQLLTQLA